MRKSLSVIIPSILACSVLYYVEQDVGVNYLVKTVLKLMMFIGIPFLFHKVYKDQKILEVLNYRKLVMRECKSGLVLGGVAFIVIMLAYVVLKGYIDFENILVDLQDKLKITSGRFIIIGFYITFFNSLLEEFFFRGFMFLTLYNSGYKKLAYLSSSLLFGLYHMAIFKTWFSLPLQILAIFSLVIVSSIFSLIDRKSQMVFNSWIVHIMGDAAIILIGIRLFFL